LDVGSLVNHSNFYLAKTPQKAFESILKARLSSMYGDWNALGEVQYRKWAVYEPMLWQGESIRLGESIVASAPYGGPLAITRDPRRLILPGEKDNSNEAPKIGIYSSAGQLIAEVDSVVAFYINIIILALLICVD
jgi:hypothetical protein